MVVYAEYREVGDRLVATTACQRCSTVIGELSIDEVSALSTGRYGPVLCFDCEEESCVICQKELTLNETITLRTICWFCYHEQLEEQPLEAVKIPKRL
jgi:hypothetical protein